MVKAGGRRDAAVERHGHFHQDERTMGLDPAGEAFVEAAGFLLADAEDGFDARGTQRFEALAGDCGIGVEGSGDDASYSGGDERLCAGSGAAGEIAGLEGDVGCASRSARSGFAQGNNFGVVAAVVLVPAFAGEMAFAVEHNATDCGIRRSKRDAATGEVEGALHVLKIVIG